MRLQQQEQLKEQQANPSTAVERYGRGDIFLLELVVDYVHLNQDAYNAETCVTFGFLNNGPIYVRENEFRSNVQQATDENYIKHGKSCLFSLSPMKMQEHMKDFDVNIGVYKIVTIESQVQPQSEMVLIGRAVIPLAHLYRELLNEMYANQYRGSAISKNLDGCFELVNSNYESAGRINLFLRITCYGKSLISNIQMSVKSEVPEHDDMVSNYVQQQQQQQNSAQKIRTRVKQQYKNQLPQQQSKLPMTESSYAHHPNTFCDHHQKQLQQQLQLQQYDSNKKTMAQKYAEYVKSCENDINNFSQFQEYNRQTEQQQYNYQ